MWCASKQCNVKSTRLILNSEFKIHSALVASVVLCYSAVITFTEKARWSLQTPLWWQTGFGFPAIFISAFSALDPKSMAPVDLMLRWMGGGGHRRHPVLSAAAQPRCVFWHQPIHRNINTTRSIFAVILPLSESHVSSCTACSLCLCSDPQS